MKVHINENVSIGESMSVAALARQRVHRMKRGIPFSISGFYSLGSRASVQQAMSRLVKEGLLVRVERG
ncbi:hypothetical protein ACLD11_21820, partial [Salmonella sp. 741265116_PST]